MAELSLAIRGRRVKVTRGNHVLSMSELAGRGGCRRKCGIAHLAKSHILRSRSHAHTHTHTHTRTHAHTRTHTHTHTSPYNVEATDQANQHPRTPLCNTLPHFTICNVIRKCHLGFTCTGMRACVCACVTTSLLSIMYITYRYIYLYIPIATYIYLNQRTRTHIRACARVLLLRIRAGTIYIYSRNSSLSRLCPSRLCPC